MEMKIKVTNSIPNKIKTKLLVVPKKSKKFGFDIVNNANFLANRVLQIEIKDFSAGSLKRLGAKAVSYAKKLKIDELSISLPNIANIKELSSALTEGLILSHYDFDKFKTKNKAPKIKEVKILASKNLSKIKEGVEEGKIISKYVCLARDFVNYPSNYITPSIFARKIAKMSRKNKLKVKIYGEKEIERMGMNCFLGVARGSSKEPKLVVLEYKGNKSKDVYALVGKGVTFDSGGISLKPSQGMHEMKGDMAGGAVVAAAINAAAELKLPVNLIAVVPCVENMPGGNAMKPGDVLKSMSGKTVEVLNTDAEGRLILADALYFVSKKSPKYIIDLATLTGSCIMALGYNVAGLMGNNKKLENSIFEAGEKTKERVWKMPLYKEYSDAIKSDIADIKNLGYDSGVAGLLTAAAFLKEFVGKTSWAHIDIAGTSWTKESRDDSPKGATGWGVRLLVEFLKNMK